MKIFSSVKTQSNEKSRKAKPGVKLSDLQNHVAAHKPKDFKQMNLYRVDGTDTLAITAYVPDLEKARKKFGGSLETFQRSAILYLDGVESSPAELAKVKDLYG